VAPKPNLSNAIRAIEKLKICLLYPLNNRKDPPSLWSYFYPRKKMKWEWTDTGDDSVADMWILRERLSRSGKVVYCKWYQGRATFFSRECFTHLLCYLGAVGTPRFKTKEAKIIYEILEDHSPLSTKKLKKYAELQGRFLEPAYNRAIKELWSRALVVGWGEVDEGAFPSLNIGATKYLFEDLWIAASEISQADAENYLLSVLKLDDFIKRHVVKLGATNLGVKS
jgi:hypothetical protein